MISMILTKISNTNSFFLKNRSLEPQKCISAYIDQNYNLDRHWKISVV